MKTTREESTIATPGDEYATAQGRLEAAERTYADAEAALLHLEARAAAGADVVTRVRAKQQVPAAREAREAALLAREEARAVLTEVTGRHAAAVRADFLPRKREAAEAVLADMQALTRSMGALLDIENAEAAALGVRPPIECGTSLALTGWVPSGLPHESRVAEWARMARREGLLP